jgi:hypothetical protein
MKEKNLISLNVFYKNSLYTTIEEQAALDLFIFIVNFGSLLGLFSGVSVLSLIEIIEIFTEFIIFRFKK